MLTCEQIEIRKRTIGASESAAALGLSKWKTPLDVYMEKIGMAPIQEDNEAMYWGRAFEEPIASRYEEETGNVLIPWETEISNKYDFMSCNLDRRGAHCPELKEFAVECKNVGHFGEEWGEPGTDEIPTQYLIQVAHQSIVCDLDYVDIAALGNRYDFRIYRYNRNPKLEEKIIEGLRKFWYENVLAGIPPEAKTMGDISLLYKGDSIKTLDADEEIIKDVEEYRTLKQCIKNHEEKMDEIKLRICKKMGNASEIVHEGKSIITFRPQIRKSFDSKKLIEDMPELKEKYDRKTEFRVFRVICGE